MYEISQGYAGRDVSPLPVFFSSDAMVTCKHMGALPIISDFNALSCLCICILIQAKQYIHMHTYTCIYIYIHIHSNVCICMYCWYGICMWLTWVFGERFHVIDFGVQCLSIVCICMYMHVYAGIWKYMHVYVYIYVCICMYCLYLPPNLHQLLGHDLASGLHWPKYWEMNNK
jgi:hypothetical protein